MKQRVKEAKRNRGKRKEKDRSGARGCKNREYLKEVFPWGIHVVGVKMIPHGPYSVKWGNLANKYFVQFAKDFCICL